MFTGWPAHVRGHRSFQHLLAPDEPNMFRYLKEAGYDVLWFGKNDVLSFERFGDSVTEWAFFAPVAEWDARDNPWPFGHRSTTAFCSSTPGLWAKHAVGSTVNMSKMIEAADVNGDGRLDVVATDSENRNSGIFWFEAPADPVTGKWVRHDVDNGYNGLDSMSVADMNGDGRPDIVAGETKDRLRLAIYENVGGGKSWKQHLISEGKESHKGANAVELDGDGDLDLVSISYFGFKDLHVWRNDNGR